jgi:aminopeptidase-like protein
MSIAALRTRLDLPALGAEAHALAARLYPILRSITGPGVRETLRILGEYVPVALTETPSGTPVLDWVVPDEWTLRTAWIKDPAGHTVLNVADHSLHVLNYSTPVRATLPLSALRPHLFTLPDQPALIPYRTSYYKAAWGFCLSQQQLEALPDGDYEVCIDSTLAPGSLTYGEVVLPGESTDEVMLSAHVCHPSLANDNLSGLTVLTLFARALAMLPTRRFTWRMLFAPGTIGAITWLASNHDTVGRIKHGLVVTGIGDRAGFTYKQTRAGDAAIDRVVAYALKSAGAPHSITPFMPYGYDERQYNSPGFALPVGCLMRSGWGTYPEYHTSGDNLDLITPASLGGALDLLLAVAEVIEGDAVYINAKPYGEPMLGKRGLYGATGGAMDKRGFEIALLWVLNQSDGARSLLDIAERSGLPFAAIRAAADALLKTDLLTS